MSRDLAAALPLAGRVILVTRAEEQAGRFAALLEEAGGRVLVVPTIVIEPPTSWAPLDEALARAREYQWAIFTSVNGVEMVRRRLERAGGGREALASCRIAAIGPATAEALADVGARRRDHSRGVRRRESGRAAAAAGPGGRPRPPPAGGGDARRARARALRAWAPSSTRWPPTGRARRPSGRRTSDALERGEIDVVTFTSSSTVRNFAALFDPRELSALMRGVTVACIGPITRETASALGLPTHIMPTAYTIPALARAIAAHFEEQRS